MDPIVLSAIKKAKKELEERHQVSAQTLDDLKSALADLKDTKLPEWVQDILTKVDQGTSGTGSALAQLKSSLETKLSPWTGTRAAKLDNLDAKVSSRLSKVDFDTGSAAVLDKIPDVKDWTPARAKKVDRLDVEVSSRQAAWGATSTHASRIDATISSRASQSSVDGVTNTVTEIKTRGMVKSIQRGTIVGSGRPSVMSVTISPVDTNKSVVIVNGTGYFYGSSSGNTHASVALTNATTLSISYFDNAKTYTGTTNWQVIEFY